MAGRDQLGAYPACDDRARAQGAGRGVSAPYRAVPVESTHPPPNGRPPGRGGVAGLSRRASHLDIATVKDYFRNMTFASPPTPTLSTPRWRDVAVAAAGRGISYAGDGLSATALALTLQTNGDSGFGVAALLLAGTLPIALLGPAGGRLAD